MTRIMHGKVDEEYVGKVFKNNALKANKKRKNQGYGNIHGKKQTKRLSSKI